MIVEKVGKQSDQLFCLADDRFVHSSLGLIDRGLRSYTCLLDEFMHYEGAKFVYLDDILEIEVGKKFRNWSNL